MLSLKDVQAAYGPIRALWGIDLTVPAGGIVCLLGANGAGKTTTLRLISGLLPTLGGSITFDGHQLNGKSAADIVRLGIAHVPEGRQIFPDLTVEENLRMGGFARRGAGGWRADLAGVYSRFPRLAERRRQLGGTLSGGEQQMLAIGRALMARPRLLLLDEPSLGLAPLLVREIFSIIRAIHAQGTAVLLVEQNVFMALQVADYGYVLETGRVALAAPSAELQANPQVRRSYLGR